MNLRREIWQEKAWVWILPAVFLLLQVLALVVYQARYAGGVERLEVLYEREADALASLQEQRARGEWLLQRSEEEQSQLDELYEVRFATEAERHTDFLKEVRKLARSAGLDPVSFSYPRVALEEQGLVRFDVEFSIQGSYEELRSFVNLLELTDQFVILETVGLGSSGDRSGRQGPQLSIEVSLSTYYLDTPLVTAGAEGGRS